MDFLKRLLQRKQPTPSPTEVARTKASGPKLNLDAAAAEIEKRRPTWSAAGFTVGDLTWRDRAPGWPYPLVSRADAKSPDSVGVWCIRGRVEFSVVVFDPAQWSTDQGGWADVYGVDLDGAIIETAAPEVPDIAAFGRLLDDVFERWRSVPSG